MNARDLRIGNWVTIDNPKAWPEMKDIPVQVTMVELCTDEWFPKSTGSVRLEYECNLEEHSQFDEFIKPIPLSEEWLERFGFIKSRMHGYDQHFQYRHHKLRSPITALYNSDFAMSLDNCARTIQHVHQLQNLYFSLTSEELTLKEK